MQAFIYKLSNKNFSRMYSRKSRGRKQRKKGKDIKTRVRKTKKKKIVKLIKFKQMLISNNKNKILELKTCKVSEKVESNRNKNTPIFSPYLGTR